MQNREQLRQQNFSMITDWQQSGLSQKKQCEQNNIAYHHFHYWYKRYRHHHPIAVGSPASSPAGFVSLSIHDPIGCAIEMLLPGGRRILFHQPVSCDYLKSLIS